MDKILGTRLAFCTNLIAIFLRLLAAILVIGRAPDKALIRRDNCQLNVTCP